MWLVIGKDILEGFSKILAECVVMGPQQQMFNSIFKKEYSEIEGLCCFMRLNIPRKNLQKIRCILGIFQKKYILLFKMVSNGKILKNIDKITYKTPYRPFLENFEKLKKSKILPSPITP